MGSVSHSRKEDHRSTDQINGVSAANDKWATKRVERSGVNSRHWWQACHQWLLVRVQNSQEQGKSFSGGLAAVTMDAQCRRRRQALGPPGFDRPAMPAYACAKLASARQVKSFSGASRGHGCAAGWSVCKAMQRNVRPCVDEAPHQIACSSRSRAMAALS